MKKLVFLALLLLPALASAQIPSGYIQATATVPILANGSFGAAWTNLSSSPQLGLLGCVSTFQTTVNGTIDSYGKFSVLLADPGQICPSPSTWTFTFSCHTPPGAFITPITVTGAGSVDDISAQIIAAAPTNICAGGGGSGITVETNGAPNFSQTLLNFTDTSTIKFLNPSGGVESANCTTATSSLLGCSRPDNTTIAINSGVLSSLVSPVNFQHNDTNLTGSFVANPQILDFNDTTPAAPSGFVNVTFSPDTATGRLSAYVPNTAIPSFDMEVLPPISGQFAVVYPTTGTITSDPPGLSNIFANGVSSAGGSFTWKCVGLLCSIAGNTAANWTGWVLPSYINPANVTAIYADAVTSSGTISNYAISDSFSGTNLTCNGQQLMLSQNSYPYESTEVSGLTGLTGANFNSLAACSIQVGGSGPGSHGQLVNVAAVRFLVFYTGTPPPVDTALHLQPPLMLNTFTNTLFIDQSNWAAAYLTWRPIAELPPAAANANNIYFTNDGTTDSDCTVGGGDGTHEHFCLATGSGTYVIIPGSGGSSGLSGMTAGQVPIAATANTVTSSKPLGGSGAVIPTGPSTTTNLDCVQFSGTIGQIADSGSPCDTGSGVSGSGTTGFIPKWTGSTALGNSAIDDGITTVGVITATEPIAVAVAGGQGGTFNATEGTAASAASGHDILYADSTAHCLEYSANGGSFACLGTGSAITALTGDVTATGPGSAAATIANAAVTYAKMQHISANSVLLGSGASGSGASPVEITLGTNLSMSGTTLNASGGSTGYVLISPSGDTSCAADTTAISTAIASGANIKLASGIFYVGTGSGNIFTISNPLKLEGTGPGSTIITKCPANATLFNVNYQIAGGSASNSGTGAIIRGFDVQQKSGVTATGGCDITVASSSGAGFYVPNFHAEDIAFYNTWRALCTSTGALSDWWKDLYIMNELDAGLYYDTAVPGGDQHFDDIEMTGLNTTGVKINQADTIEFTNLKLNGSKFAFLGGGNTFRVRSVGASIEGGAGGVTCGVDFGTSSSPTQILFNEGNIGLTPLSTAFCNFSNATTLTYSFNDYTVNDLNGWRNNWNAVILGQDVFAGSSLSANWTAGLGAGTFSVSSNKVTGSSTGSVSWAYYNAATSGDQTVILVLNGTGAGTSGPVVRAQAGAESGYALDCNGGTQCKLFKVAAGSFTQLGSTFTGTWSTGAIAKLVANGTGLYAYINGTLIISATDTTYASGFPGMEIQSTANSISNYTATNP